MIHYEVIYEVQLRHLCRRHQALLMLPARRPASSFNRTSPPISRRQALIYQKGPERMSPSVFVQSQQGSGVSEAVLNAKCHHHEVEGAHQGRHVIVIRQLEKQRRNLAGNARCDANTVFFMHL